jgi:hypothetical protein
MINITQDYEELQGATQASETCPYLLKEFWSRGKGKNIHEKNYYKNSTKIHIAQNISLKIN